MADVTTVVMIRRALLLLVAASICFAEVCHISDPIQRRECSSVSMMYGASSQIHTSVLQQLCEGGHRHVLLKGATPTQHQILPTTSPRRAEQFAVLYIQRDDFSDAVTWKSGEAVDTMCDADWYVDEETKMTNGYNWYTYGLPFWPMLNQSLAQKKQGLLSRKKKVEWPNYAIATPFYLVPYEIYNSRDPVVGIQKLFAGDFVRSGLANQHAGFANPSDFKQTVASLYQLLFLDQTGYARKTLSSDFDEYSYWLQPMVRANLQPMLESFLQTQTPKKGQSAICPDELYLYFHQQPCASTTTCLMLNEYQLILKLVNCPDTKVVVGYGVNRQIVAEEIIPSRTLGKAQSAPPSSRVGNPGKTGSSGATHSTQCHLHMIVGLLVVVLTLRPISSQV